MRSRIFGIRIAIIALVAYWIALTVSTHVPVTVLRAVQQNTGWGDKSLHFAAFAILAFLLAWAVPTRLEQRSWNVLNASIIAVAYAAVDELTQIPVGRTADWADFSADLFGILAGLLAYIAMREVILAASMRLEP